MKGKNIIKKLTLYSSLITILFMLSSSDLKKKNRDYFRNKMNVTKNKIEYSLGNIYVGDTKYLEELENLDEHDIIVLDDRDKADPNFKIYNSFMVTDSEIREEIIESLLYYEELFPSNWNRTKNSLIREWFVHNLMHYLGYKHYRTTDVDLNNADEKTYRVKK